MSNTRPILLVAFFVAVSPNLTPAGTPADQAVFTVIQGADPTLVNRKVLYRNAVAADLDLVIAIGSPAEWPLDPNSPAIWWDEKRKLGLFLQERARPDRVVLACARRRIFGLRGADRTRHFDRYSDLLHR